jgi:hypothetical protein
LPLTHELLLAGKQLLTNNNLDGSFSPASITVTAQKDAVSSPQAGAHTDPCAFKPVFFLEVTEKSSLCRSPSKVLLLSMPNLPANKVPMQLILSVKARDLQILSSAHFDLPINTAPVLLPILFMV